MIQILLEEWRDYQHLLNSNTADKQTTGFHGQFESSHMFLHVVADDSIEHRPNQEESNGIEPVFNYNHMVRLE